MLSRKVILANCIIFTAVFLLFGVLMETSRVAVPPVYNIVDLEFAWTGVQVDTILSTWGAAVVAQELYITFLDFGYLAGYGLMAFWLLYLGWSLLADIQAKGGKIPSQVYLLSKYALIFPLVSAGSDVVENLNLISMMGAFPAPASPAAALAASVFATIKFSLLGLSLLVFIVELVIFLARRKGT